MKPGDILLPWVDPRLDSRPSPLGGQGLFARTPIQAGAVLLKWGGVVYTRAEILAGKANPETIAVVDQNLYLADPVGALLTDEYTLNHSCDPNAWMLDAITLAARRPIAAGDEVTADYALWLFEQDWELAPCRCHSPLCRGQVTSQDWRRPELQARYQGHFTPYLNRLITITTIKRISGGLGLVLALLVLGYMALRPFHLQWGARPEEISRAMPGDLTGARWTRAVTITSERTRLARDLHDAVTQTLFSTTLIAEELRPNALVEVPLPTLLRQLTEAQAGRSRTTIQLSAEGERKLPADVQVGLSRLAQQALNNVVKHAKASQAMVTLRMRERAEAIGAKFSLYSEPCEGTQISVVWEEKPTSPRDTTQ